MITIGQKVLLYNPVNKKGVCKKLKRTWCGPFFITAEGDGYVYKLRRCSDGHELRTFILSNRLRPIHEPRDRPPVPPLPDKSTSSDNPLLLTLTLYRILWMMVGTRF